MGRIHNWIREAAYASGSANRGYALVPQQLLPMTTCSLTTAEWCRIFPVLVMDIIKKSNVFHNALDQQSRRETHIALEGPPIILPKTRYDRGAFAPGPAMAADTDRCAPAHNAHRSETPAPGAGTERCALAHDAHDSETPAPAAGTDRCALTHDAHDSEAPAPANVAHTDSNALARVAHESGALTAADAGAFLPDDIHLVLFAATYLESRYRVLLDRAHNQSLLLDLGDVEDPPRMREQLILEFRADPFLDDDVLTVLKVGVSILSSYNVYGKRLHRPIPMAASRIRVSQSPSAFDVPGSRLAY